MFSRDYFFPSRFFLVALVTFFATNDIMAQSLKDVGTFWLYVIPGGLSASDRLGCSAFPQPLCNDRELLELHLGRISLDRVDF